MSKNKSGYSTENLVFLMGKKVRGKRDDYGKAEVEGWLVGSTYRRTGKVVDDYDNGRVFQSTGPSRHVFLVCPWPTMRAVDVVPSSLEVLPDEYEIQNPNWLSVYRKDMATIMSKWPRNSRGQFVRKKLS